MIVERDILYGKLVGILGLEIAGAKKFSEVFNRVDKRKVGDVAAAFNSYIDAVMQKF